MRTVALPPTAVEPTLSSEATAHIREASMTCEVESIVVTCPRCGNEYATWQGVGLEILGPDPCPRCGFTPAEDPRLHRDRTLTDLGDDDRE
jgi:hypothetical protein